MAYMLTNYGKESAQVDYRFARTQARRDSARARGSFRGIKGFLTNLIKAIGKSKVRRMERKLGFRRIRYDREANNWVSGQGAFRGSK